MCANQQLCRQTKRMLMNRLQAVRLEDRYTDRWIDIQAVRQTSKLTDRQTVKRASDVAYNDMSCFSEEN